MRTAGRTRRHRRPARAVSPRSRCRSRARTGSRSGRCAMACAPTGPAHTRKRFIRPRLARCSSSSASLYSPRRIRRNTPTIPTSTTRLSSPMIHRNTPDTDRPDDPGDGVQGGVVVADLPGECPDPEPEQEGQGEHHRRVAEGEPEPDRQRSAAAVGEQLAGGVVDRGDVVGVEGVPQAEGVGEHAEPQDVQQRDEPEHAGERPAVVAVEGGTPPAGGGGGPGGDGLGGGHRRTPGVGAARSGRRDRGHRAPTAAAVSWLLPVIGDAAAAVPGRSLAFRVGAPERMSGRTDVGRPVRSAVSPSPASPRCGTRSPASRRSSSPCAGPSPRSSTGTGSPAPRTAGRARSARRAGR